MSVRPEAELVVGLPEMGMATWLLASLPLLVLFALILSGRLSSLTNGLVALAAAACVSAVGFGAGPQVLAVGVGKGLWLGLWILCVIWSALFLYHCSRQIGFKAIAGALNTILPREVENVLVVAWIFASLIQGAAGFGVPIAVTAPLLFAMGLRPGAAVLLPLIGYHWSVGFGSMGSSFYMASLTAGLSASETERYALQGAILLGLQCLAAGILVAFLHSGWRGVRQSWRVLAFCGPVMAAAQVLASQVEPAIASLSAGVAGIAAVVLLRTGLRMGGRRDPDLAPARELVGVPAQAFPSGDAAPLTGPARHTATEREPEHGANEPAERARSPWLVLLPHGVLIVLALLVYLPSASREWVKHHLVFAPSWPPTVTSFGYEVEATREFSPIALLGHPGSYVVVASIVALAVWRLIGLWPRRGLRGAIAPWARSSYKAAPTVLIFAVLATVMNGTGMVSAIAVGVADTLGDFYPLVVPSLGAVGAFLTGSTTSSNALFSALHHDVASFIGTSPTPLLAAQLAGGNVGNSISPVVAAVGLSAMKTHVHASGVVRQALLPAMVLIVLCTIATAAIVMTS